MQRNGSSPKVTCCVRWYPLVATWGNVCLGRRQFSAESIERPGSLVHRDLCEESKLMFHGGCRHVA